MNFIRKENSLQRSLTSRTKLLKIIEAIEFKNMLSDEGDTLVPFCKSLVLVEPKAAESMLMRMYMMWGEKYGYKIKELNYQEEVVGIKTVTLEFEGDYSLVIL
jgi:peptide chain release factor 2